MLAFTFGCWRQVGETRDREVHDQGFGCLACGKAFGTARTGVPYAATSPVCDEITAVVIAVNGVFCLHRLHPLLNDRGRGRRPKDKRQG